MSMRNQGRERGGNEKAGRMRNGVKWDKGKIKTGRERECGEGGEER